MVINMTNYIQCKCKVIQIRVKNPNFKYIVIGPEMAVNVQEYHLKAVVAAMEGQVLCKELLGRLFKNTMTNNVMSSYLWWSHKKALIDEEKTVKMIKGMELLLSDNRL